MNKKCALLTIEDLSYFESYDDLLIEPFNLLGWECIFIPWESKSVDWDDFDAVIIEDLLATDEVWSDVKSGDRPTSDALENTFGSVELIVCVDKILRVSRIGPGPG